MSFTPKEWRDYPSGGTPVTAAELNRVERGIRAVADDVRALTVNGFPADESGNIALTVTPYETSFFDLPGQDQIIESTNLIDKTKIIDHYLIPTGTATPDPRDEFCYTDPPASIKGSTSYTMVNVLRVTWLDASGNYVGDDSPFTEQNTYTSPAAATQAIFSIRDTLLHSAQANEGDTLLPYEPGGVTIIEGDGPTSPVIKAEFLPPQEGGFDPPATADADRYVLDVPLDGTYTAPTIPSQFPTLWGTTTADVHGWYDALVTAHPDYVSRTSIGIASNGSAMYRYDLKPPEVPTTGLGEKVPKIMLISGIHGYEKSAVYTLHKIAEALANSDGSDPVLDALRWNFHIIIMPVGNPYGYDLSNGINPNEGRNANGVNIARNFTAGWSSGTPGSSTYGGPAPLSEPEAIALDNIMAANAEDLVFGASMHNFSATTAQPDRFIWNAAASQLQMNVGKALIRRLSRKWKAEHAYLSGAGDYLGYADRMSPGGSEGQQFVSYGIHGATFEYSQVMRHANDVTHSGEALTLGMEAQANYIALMAKAGLESKNARTDLGDA